ncbi:MAG: glycosyltransferase family 2 protein [Candidatus Magasanikbacteria bacterium]|nr:glycosyltransferase family 2 protein [Candidatus Magasanikbacteria bacterium]
MEQRISLVIPAYNEEKYIYSCLKNAIENSEGGFFEIIVVDNNSSDNTAQVAAQFPGIRVVCEKQKGTGYARQRGLEEARGEWVAFVDADTHIPSDWIIKARAELKQNQQIVSLSGPYKYYDISHWQNIIMKLVWWLFAPLAYKLVGYMILGGNVILKKEAMLAVGGFDKEISFYGDDTNAARRLSGAGKVVFKMDFIVHGSARRFRQEGFVRTNINYALNFLWQVIFHRPFTKFHQDVRLD